MAENHPENYDYLAVVSEWWTQKTQGSGVVGNAYPMLNLTTGKVVESPRDEFPNPGAVFLMNRSGFKTWDFVSLRPQENPRYNNTDHRTCYYIPSRQPTQLNLPNQIETVAVVLEHPAFDPNSSTRQLLNPRHNVTPIFFVQKNHSIIGPLIRDVMHLSPMEDVQRIDWRPAREDGIVYELTREELARCDIRLTQFSHPDPSLNRVLASPILFATGAVRRVKSGKPLDVLPDANLIDWYLEHCPTVEIPDGLLASLKAAFRGKPSDDPFIQATRLLKIEREMTTHAAFQAQQERFARQYVESEPGQQRIQDLLAQAVTKKASEIQDEVDKRQTQLAARRVLLDTQLSQAEEEHRRLLQSLESDREAVQQQTKDLQAAVEQLRALLAADVRQLAARMQEQLPLFAALAAARLDPQAQLQVSSGGIVPPGKATGPEFRPISPSMVISPVDNEAKLVEDLHIELARRGLHFARDFVGNVYTSLKAESLNLIMGPPGYGKSMLVTTLARSLGHGDAFLRIAVQRSWSEDRYLLGFYDSFHGRYDPGATGLVPRMLQADADWRQHGPGIYLVLLDEFNLAAPEYYFSQLLQTLPSDDPVREIALYDGSSSGGEGFPGRVTLNPNIRFWGTINYDETTERLSPRILDRTGMIFLGDADVESTLEDEPAAMPGVGATDVFKKFVRDAKECPEDRWEIVSPVIDFLRTTDASLGPRIELSPRVTRAIKRYLANSINVLPARTAVDYVVQQRILPVVRGRGDDYFARISRLAQLLSDANLSRSALHVEEALRRSEQQFGELDFFSY